MLSRMSRVEHTVQTSAEQAKAMQDTLRVQADKLAASGRVMYDSASKQLVASGKQMVDEKKAQATEYLLQQKELLKQEAKKQVELEAQKKINAAFSGL